MKRYLYILTLGVLFSFTSCVQEDLTIGNGTYPSSNGGIQIIGASEDFDVKQVGTRADDEVVSDSFISEMTMLIFKADGYMLTAYNANKEELKSSHINIRRSNPTFLIETSKYEDTGILASMEAGMTIKYYDNTADDIKNCSIYIIANVYHLIGERLENGEIKTLTQLEAALLDTNIKLDMPFDEETGEYIGLPMIGCARDQDTKELATFDLSYHNGESNNNAVATIPLKKLYSKVCFSIQVNSKQMVPGQTPEFVLDDVEVFNVPSKVRMGYQSGDYVVNLPDTVATPYLYRYVSETQNTPFSFIKNDMMPSDRTCSHSSSEDTEDVVSFYFYMPEHKVTPFYTDDTYNYPDNLPTDNRQYFKPKLIKDTNNDGITESDKIATFVRIHGSYTDHNGQIHKVAYDIYLGQDEVDDFEIKRNQQLVNRLVITGITNHKDTYGGSDNTISIDHRVSVTHKGYNLSMEREAILDAHFEVRPLDIELQPGASMTIVIPGDYKEWIAMEDDAASDTGGKYVSNDYRKGVRKYFTTDLVSELNAAPSPDTKGNGRTITISNSSSVKEIHRIWFYIDENPNVYDKTGATTPNKDDNGDPYNVNDTRDGADPRYRLAKVNFYFAENGQPDTSVNPTATINFQQWNLWRVWAKDANGNPVRYYDIEHEEEYLNNYASDMQYGQTQNGMEWGLNDIQLSYEFQSLYAVQSGGSGLGALIDAIGSILGAKTAEEFANVALGEKGVSPKYDFYLTRDIQSMPSQHQDKFEKFDYSGLYFSSKIAKYLRANYSSHQQGENSDATIDRLKLTDDPNSALAYSLNKNKRNTDGTLDLENIKWHLPAIDEIEEIAKAAYDEFDRVFQNNLYWSSQPAFTKNELNVTKIGNFLANYGKLTGTFYEDDKYRARSTFVYTNDGGNSWVPCSSEAPGITKTISGEIEYVKITSSISFDDLKTTTKTITDYTSTPGNKARTDKCRIRAVYRSGTK